ncbi:MAG TPA: hypothetical protein VNY74_06145 [Edaphobacter sp.]|jgi:hypothetical protein|nr:hypothetical protein [Edaphobacter sp.]
MTDFQLTTVLETLAAAVILSFVLFRLVPIFRVDVFRQEMFELRDQLFDYAAAGNIAFNHPAYLLLRKLMNGLIRYGHQLTLYRVVMSGLHRKIDGGRPHLKWNHEWEVAVARIGSPQVRSKIMNYHARTIRIATKHLIAGSPTLIFLMAVCIFALVAKEGYLGLRTLIRISRDRLMNSTILDQRYIEEDAVIYTG